MTLPAPIRLAVADGSPVVRSIFNALPSDEAVVRAQARNRQELERAAADSIFDAIVCSDNLSGPLGGVEALRQLRERRLVHSDTAFIVMAENTHRDHLLACTQVHPDAILLKPFSLAAMSARLKRAVRGRRAMAKLRRLDELEQWDGLLAEARFLSSPLGGGYRVATQFEAKALAKLDRQLDADAIYEQALVRTPGLLWAEEALARSEFARGDTEASESRLLRLVKAHPSHVDAHELLHVMTMTKGDMAGAQAHLTQLARFSGNLDRRQELGHLAVLNGDIETAVWAYGGVLDGDMSTRLFADFVNLARALLLNGDVLGATKALTSYQARGRKDLLLPALDYFISGARSRHSGHLGQAQTNMVEGIRLIEGHPDAAVPRELLLMAVEACLIAVLTYQAAERSRILLTDYERPMHPHQMQWLFKLHDWAREEPSDLELPRGLRGYRRFLT